MSVPTLPGQGPACPTAAHTAGALRALGATALTAVAVAVACLAPAAQAQEPATAASTAARIATGADERGFSYFMGIGRQTVRYREYTALLPVTSAVTTSNPMLVSGALYVVTDKLLFSLDSETTFAAGRGTEHWQSTEPVFNNITLTDRELQRNGYSLTMSNLQLLGHYQVANNTFGSAGLTARSASFKRFGFQVGPDNAVALPQDRTVEESVSEVLLQLGATLDTEKVRGTDTHYSVRGLVGLPLWRRVENTQLPLQTFGRSGGWDLSLEGRYSRAVRPNVHVGLWGRATVAERPRDSQGNAELPRSRMDSLSYGIEVLWKL